MPTLTLLAVESFCAGAGVILFILGLISCFVPRHFRLGVITMCISNIFFVLAIAFPKKISLYFLENGFQVETLNTDCRYWGVGCGLVLAAIFYLIYVKGFKKIVIKLKENQKALEEKQEKSE